MVSVRELQYGRCHYGIHHWSSLYSKTWSYIEERQAFSQGVVPQQINVHALERVIPRRFFGANEVRTIEQRTTRTEVDKPPGYQKNAAKGKASTSKTGSTKELANVKSTTAAED